MNQIKWDPRMFINPPFIKCPKCGKDTFGVLMITGHHYCRRCKECLYPPGHGPAARFPLPKLNKKVIYIDQFAISNMMKQLNPKVKNRRKTSLDEFWLKLFEKLDRLCSAQLIVCPETPFHGDESLMVPYFKSLKKMYDHLSQEIKFWDYEIIRRFQVLDNAKNWITGKLEKEINLDVTRVVYGEINEWKDRIRIYLTREDSLQWIDALRLARERVHEGMKDVFKRWQSEKGKSFKDWFEEECLSAADSIVQSYQEYRNRVIAKMSGKIEWDPLDIIPGEQTQLFIDIKELFKKHGVNDSDIPQKTIDYFVSESFKNVPYVKIGSMLYASIARKAKAGQKKPPNQWMTYDVINISTYLPYCDAMFIDNDCCAYLSENPLAESIDYGTKLFSLNNKEELLDYLDKIESNTPNEILEKVNEVYGEDWLKPHIDLYRS